MARTHVKKLSEGATACLFHLPLQAFAAAIMKLMLASFFVMVRNLMMGTPRTGDKSAIQNK